MTTTYVTTTCNTHLGTRPPSAQLDDIYDDACDLGQFMLNPCWFLFVKTQKALDRSKTKTSATSSSSWHAVQEKCYYALMGGGWTVILIRVEPMVSSSDWVADYHKVIGYLLFAAVVMSWRYAKTTPPGTITADTVWRFDNYAYDNILYPPSSDMIMGVPKLARSKYDRYSGQHVPRFDHFCGWLGTPIGEENYRYFLLFVLVHTFMALYGCVVVFALLWEQGGQSETLGRLDPFAALFCVLMGVSTIPLCGFSAFHAHLVYKGMTTNEYFKWRVIHQQEAPLSSREVDTLLRVPPASGNSHTPTQNYYNLGLKANIYEVLFPRSLRTGLRGKRV